MPQIVNQKWQQNVNQIIKKCTKICTNIWQRILPKNDTKCASKYVLSTADDGCLWWGWAWTLLSFYAIRYVAIFLENSRNNYISNILRNAILLWYKWISPVGWSKKKILADKKRLYHRCQYVWRAKISIFRFLSPKMVVFRHFLVLEGDIIEGISENRFWAITFYWSVLRT